MIMISVNGERREVADGTTVFDLVASMLGSSRGVAVSLDREVVPKSSWSSTLVRPGAQIEILAAAAGG